MTSTEKDDIQMGLLKEKNGNGKKSPTGGRNTKEVEITIVSKPKAPDGGWGWVVVFGAFMCNFIVDGIMFSFDIMRKAFSDEFPEVQPYEIQIMGSLIPGLYMALAPFASLLLNIFGARPLVMAGSVIAALAFLASAFVRNFYLLLLLYGCVGGIAFTFIYSPSIIAVGLYFDKKRATATGITVCGSCVGTFALGSMMLFLNDFYGSWRGVLIICAGVVLNCVVFGAFFRPLSKAKLEKITVTQEEVENGNEADNPFIIQKMVEEKILAASPEAITKVDVQVVDMGVMRSHEPTGLDRVMEALRVTFDMNLLTSPTFLILCLAAFLGMLGFFTPFFFGTSYAQHNGMSPVQGLWVINCVAIANAVGRVLCGILSDQPWADSLFITNVAMVLSGACNIIIPPFTSYGPVAFYIYAVSFGIAIAPFISLRSIIVCDLLGVEKLGPAYGFLLLFMGLAAFVGSPVLVGIKDATGFDNVFYISGVVLALSGVICFPCRRLAKWEKARAERKAKEAAGHEMHHVHA